MLGTLVNVIAVLVGGGAGLLLRSRVPDRMRKTVMQGLALCVMIVGMMNALKSEDVLGMILCIVVGGLLGEWIDIEKRLTSLGESAERLLVRDGNRGVFVQGFVAASLLFCVGPMSIVGPLESGLAANHTTQIIKGMMDGTASIFMAAAMGPGVLFSAVVILLYQGAITLSATAVAPLLTEAIIREMSAVGGLIIIGIGFNMMEIARVRVGNLLPAIFLPMGYIPLAAFVSSII